MKVPRTHSRNLNWDLHINDDGTWPTDKIPAALLMDIRDELQAIRRRLDCPEVTAIPRYLRDIRRNTTKKKRAVKAKA